MQVIAFRGPRWRGISQNAAAERLGVSPSAIVHAVNAGRLRAGPRRRGARHIAHAELRRFVTTPAAWVVVHPLEIIDPSLRAVAAAAWRAAGSPALYAPADLRRRYHVSDSTLSRWRAAGWASGCWHWHGSHQHHRGAWWLVWAGPLPPAPAARQPGAVQPTRRAVGQASRAVIVAAVLARGGAPGRGTRGGFWAAVAVETGFSAPYAVRVWWEYQRQLRPCAAD